MNNDTNTDSFLNREEIVISSHLMWTTNSLKLLIPPAIGLLKIR